MRRAHSTTALVMTPTCQYTSKPQGSMHTRGLKPSLMTPPIVINNIYLGPEKHDKKLLRTAVAILTLTVTTSVLLATLATVEI